MEKGRFYVFLRFLIKVEILLLLRRKHKYFSFFDKKDFKKQKGKFFSGIGKNKCVFVVKKIVKCTKNQFMYKQTKPTVISL